MSITDHFGAMLQIVMSLTIVIYNCNMFIVQATIENVGETSLR